MRRKPQRSVTRFLADRRAVGADESIRIDYASDTARLYDRHLMCSDGIHRGVSDGTLRAILAQRDAPSRSTPPFATGRRRRSRQSAARRVGKAKRAHVGARHPRCPCRLGHAWARRYAPLPSYKLRPNAGHFAATAADAGFGNWPACAALAASASAARRFGPSAAVGWMRPADMMSFAAASTGMSSSITALRGT
jgi:hypothetical protein